MWVDSGVYEQALEHAGEHTREWLRALPGRSVRRSTSAEDAVQAVKDALEATA